MIIFLTFAINYNYICHTCDYLKKVLDLIINWITGLFELFGKMQKNLQKNYKRSP